jgi:hypothetical protein
MVGAPVRGGLNKAFFSDQREDMLSVLIVAAINLAEYLVRRVDIAA